MPGADDREHSTTDRKVGAGFLAALAFIGVVGVVSYLSVVELDENGGSVAHSHEVMATIDALVSTTIEAEGAQRGFIITGDESFAAEYTRAAGRVTDLLHQLADSIVSDAPQSAQALRLDEAIRARLARADQVIQLRRSGGFDAVLAESKRGRPGLALQAQVRAVAQEMKNRELQHLAQRELETRQSAAITKGVIVAGGLLALGVLV